MNVSVSSRVTNQGRWKNRCLIVIGLWLISLILMSFPEVRGFVAYPLYINNEDANAEVAYVMADGFAYWERLQGASDLYSMGRVQRIMILDERQIDRYNFVKQRSDTLVDRAVDYLGWHGVPRDKISTIPFNSTAWMGSRGEAESFSKTVPDVKSLVVVTSAPHTRRSLLCFRRVLPERVRLQVYAPSTPSQSWEIGQPIWMEYAKLFVYYLFA